jgi:hypothetical protein
MSGMQIERAPRRSNYSVIPNEIFDHKGMTWRAVGMLTYLLSRPDWWVINTDRLVALHKEGRESVRTTLRELEEFGYVKRTRSRNAAGQWVHRMQVFDEPQPITSPLHEEIPDVPVDQLVEPDPEP